MINRPLSLIVGSTMGKYRLRDKIIPLIPKHKTYVEPFGGSAAVLLGKKPSEVEVYNDKFWLYYFIFNFVKNMTKEEFKQVCKFNWNFSPTRQHKYFLEFERDRFKNNSNVIKFCKAVYMIRYSFNRTLSRPTGSTSKYQYTKLWNIHERIKDVKTHNSDFKKVIEKYDAKDTFFYLDPPYESSKQLLQWNYQPTKTFKLDDLIPYLKSMKGKFILSYGSDITQKMKGFNIKKVKAERSIAGKRFNKVEILVSNFELKKEKVYVYSELSDLPDFVWIPNFVCLTGSQVYGKGEKHDTDIVIKIPSPIFSAIMEHSPDIFEALALKLERIFKKEKHFIPSSIGPNWDAIGLYDLVLKKKETPEKIQVDEDEFKKMFYFTERLRAATKETQKQAEESEKEDKIVLGRFFFPEKTSLNPIMGYRSGEVYKFDVLKETLSRIAKRNGEYKFLAQKKYDGNRVVIFKDGDKITLYSDDGKIIDNSKVPNLVDEIKNLNCENAVFDSEVEIWKGNKHLNREDVAGYLHSKNKEVNDSGVIANIFDCLYYNGKDIHKLDVFQRIEYLDKINFKQSVIGIPDTRYHLNKTPSFIIEKEAQVEEIITKLANSPASEGAMIKWGSYSLKGYSTHMLKFKKYAEIHAVILKVNKTKVPTVFNYEIGIGFDSSDVVDENFVSKVGDKKFLHIGRTYNTNIKGKVGDIITVKFHTMNLINTKKGRTLHLYEPIVYEIHPEATTPDTFKTAVKIGKDSGLLVEKEKFIENLKEYEPAKVEDKVLLDDFRILIAWLSSDIKKYNRKLIEKRLLEIVDEIIKRGIATLNLDSYGKEVSNLIINHLKNKIKKGIFVQDEILDKVLSGKLKYIIKTRRFPNVEGKDFWIVNKNNIYGTLKIKKEEL